MRMIVHLHIATSFYDIEPKDSKYYVKSESFQENQLTPTCSNYNATDRGQSSGFHKYCLSRRRR